MKKKHKEEETLWVGSLHEYSPSNKKTSWTKAITWIAIIGGTIGLICLWFWALNRF